MNNKIEIGEKVLLYGFHDGFSYETDGTINYVIQLETGERVEIPVGGVMKENRIITRRDVISRMKQLFPLSRSEWIDEILHEFGEEFGSMKYREGYEQGKLEGTWVGNQLKDADKIRQELNRVKVPQFVAEYIEQKKDDNYHLLGAMDTIMTSRRMNLYEWFYDDDNIELFAQAWIFGYEVEKEKRYLVKIIGITNYNSYLNYHKEENKWTIESRVEIDAIRTEHTRKELEDAGFGWVFDCEGIEIEEVE
jgi:hypothetical protein